MEKEGWKVLAIILLVLLILETIFIIFIISLGLTVIMDEEKCATEICGDEYTSYFYDENLRICECFINGELDKQEQFG